MKATDVFVVEPVGQYLERPAQVKWVEYHDGRERAWKCATQRKVAKQAVSQRKKYETR